MALCPPRVPRCPRMSPGPGPGGWSSLPCLHTQAADSARLPRDLGFLGHSMPLSVSGGARGPFDVPGDRVWDFDCPGP